MQSVHESVGGLNYSSWPNGVHWSVESIHFGPARLRLAGDGNDGGQLWRVMTGRLVPRALSNKELKKVRRINVCTGVIVLRRHAGNDVYSLVTS